MSTKYKLKFWFEWLSDTAFQAANDAAIDKFGLGMIPPEYLPLSSETIERVRLMAQWHGKSLNWDYPLNPSLWRQDECDRFNAAVTHLFETVVEELGMDFDVVNIQSVLSEDPDLDQYLKNAENFKRK